MSTDVLLTSSVGTSLISRVVGVCRPLNETENTRRSFGFNLYQLLLLL